MGDDVTMRTIPWDTLKIPLGIVFFAAFFLASPILAHEPVRYEYRIVPLGSLTSLQKKDKAEERTRQLETLLNGYGEDGWEMVNIFAVRTTFDPNVFFAAMKRPLPSREKN